MVKIIIFDIQANYACFKKHYTTSSVLTFDIPPKTVVQGLVGGILGYNRQSKEFIKLKTLRIGITLLNQVEKIHQGLNWLNTKVKGNVDKKYEVFFRLIMEKVPKDGFGFIGVNKHSPSNVQMLKNPKFRIYLTLDDDIIYEEIKNAIKEKCYHFTPYLGQSEFLCSIDYLGEIETDPISMNINSKKIKINSVIPKDIILFDNNKSSVEITDETFLIIENMPFAYENGKTIFKQIVYDKSGKPINSLVEEYYRISANIIIEDEDINMVLF